MLEPIYLDHNATTPLHPLVLEGMLPYLESCPSNPSSRHAYGRRARSAVDDARARVAAAVGAHPSEVIFTSSGSEANNLFIKGAAACLEPGLIAVSAIEHPCVREPAKALKKQGWSLREIGVNAEGLLDLSDYDNVMSGMNSINDSSFHAPRLVSVMLANNETGVLQNIPLLAEKARAAGALFHTDAVQAFAKLELNFRELGVHAMTLSSHKIYGPQGAAALVVDKRVDLRPLISGGGQERGLRSGSENVAAIVGFGLAAELAVAQLQQSSARLKHLRNKLEQALLALGACIFSRQAERLPNTVFFALNDIDGETLVAQLDRAGFAVASGSACSSSSPEPSHTLLAMGVAPELARAAVRVSLGQSSTEAHVRQFIQALSQLMGTFKSMAAMAAA